MPTLCDPMNCSTPGFPGHHQLPEFTQTHVHQVGDAIQPSHPLSSPSPPAANLHPQHQGHRTVPQPFLPFLFLMSCGFINGHRRSTQRGICLLTSRPLYPVPSLGLEEMLRTKWNSNHNTIVTPGMSPLLISVSPSVK